MSAPAVVPRVEQTDGRRAKRRAEQAQIGRPEGRTFEAAVPAGEDPVRYAHLLRQIRDAALSGSRAPAAARPIVDDFVAATIGVGMDPDHGRELPDAVGPARSSTDGTAANSRKVLPILGGVLLPAAEDAGHVMVVVDAGGMILWRDGPKKIQQHADATGFRGRRQLGRAPRRHQRHRYRPGAVPSGPDLLRRTFRQVPPCVDLCGSTDPRSR